MTAQVSLPLESFKAADNEMFLLQQNAMKAQKATWETNACVIILYEMEKETNIEMWNQMINDATQRSVQTKKMYLRVRMMILSNKKYFAPINF